MCILPIVSGVTLLGQYMIKVARHLVISKGGAVVYGDTDSVHFPTLRLIELFSLPLLSYIGLLRLQMPPGNG